MGSYRNFLLITLVLGFIFIALQCIGFYQLWHSGIDLKGAGSAPFMYIIFGLHGLHVLGGIVAIFIMFLRGFSTRRRNYNAVPVEVVSSYWHFVDILWIYLFIFFMFIQ